MDSEAELSETPCKKRKLAVKMGPDGDEDVSMPVKEGVKQEII